MAMLSTQTLLFPKSLSHPSLASPSFYQFSPISHLSSSSSSSSSSASSPSGFSSSMKSKNNQISRFVTRASIAESSESIGEILGDVSIFTATGEPVMIKDLWDQKENASFSGNGCGCPVEAFWMPLLLPFPLDSLYCDPDRKAYDVLGLYYGLGRTFFNPASAKVFSRFDALREAVKNYTIEATPDDRSSVLQQGGMFVFKGKQLLYSRKDEGTGDHAPLNEILDICRTVSVA
ncbi:hypothetical protein AQUCO_00900270v1 [Aquilegia coerulea]|uniref:Uncharacterized protein n=1 Tax=Aquilegia coerulea TaxID=218851 RepID=A0A2G5ECT6_AQUCA|nr:hypothetical protein AQUCO_00900270v1 [Aquilegia coerulea]